MSTRGDPGARGSLGALTGLRFLAAFAVYVSHVTAPAGAPEWVSTLMAAGYYGVTFFFVLSGFVLSLNYFDRLTAPSARGLWSYGVARFARVYPLYLAVLLYIFASGSAGPLDRWLPHVLAVQPWDPDLTRAFAYNGPGWSIGVEFFLYATLPFLVPVVGRIDRGTRHLVIAVVVTVIIMLGVTAWFVTTGRGALPWTDADSAHRWLYRMPLMRLGDFVLGVLAARIFVRVRNDPRGPRAGALLIAVAVASTVVLASSRSHLYSTFSWDVSYAVPAFALILGLALAPRHHIARFLSLPTVVLLGEASYAFYLIHKWMKAELGSGAWTDRLDPWTIYLEVSVFALVLGAAVGLHLLVEGPARVTVRRALERVPGVLAQRPWHRPPVPAETSAMDGSPDPDGSLRTWPGPSTRRPRTHASVVVALGIVSVLIVLVAGPMLFRGGSQEPVTDVERLIPPLSEVGRGADRGWCADPADVEDLTQCVHEAASSDTIVVLFGDFRAEQWFPALEQLAHDGGWRLVSLTRVHCPSVVVQAVPPGGSGPEPECATWREAALQRIGHERPDLVVIANRGGYALVLDGQTVKPGGSPVATAWRDGLVTTIGRLDGAPTAVIGDTPTMGDVPDCLARHPTDVTACEALRARAVPGGVHATEAEATQAAGAAFIDPTPWLCGVDTCPAIAEGYLRYRDAASRLSVPFAASLADELRASLDALLPAALPRSDRSAPPPG